MSNKLRAAVLQQLGGCEDTLRKVVDHTDAGAGWPGFTYLKDTIKFFDENRQLILDDLKELSDCTEDDLIRLISGFVVLEDFHISYLDIASVLLGVPTDSEREPCLKNRLSWYALESVCVGEGSGPRPALVAMLEGVS